MEGHTELGAVIVPPFLSTSQPVSGNQSAVAKVRFVQIDPFQVKFQLTESGSSKKTIQLTNICGKRIAWRIRSNAPIRYVINPACGFLTQNETQTITLELTDVNKYSDRHRFMVQAMEAKDNEKDRRKVWVDKRATNLDIVQCTRVFTLASGPGQGATETGSVLSGSSASIGSTDSTGSSLSGTTSKSATESTSGSTGSKSASTGSESASTGSESASTGSESASTGSSNAPSTALSTSASSVTSSTTGSNTTGHDDRIAELVNMVKEQLAAKDKAGHEMIQAINKVKHLEADLDRAGQQATELDNRYKTVSAQLDEMEKRSKQLEEEIKINLVPKSSSNNLA